jgi:ankyrin repeat protein
VGTSWLPLCNGLPGMSILALVHCVLCVLAHYESPESHSDCAPRASIDVGIFAGPRFVVDLSLNQYSDRSFRNGHLYILQLLISHNADPTICDQQGFNTLHLVTHSSVIMALLYLLHQPIAVDSPDAQGHTSLMWAAYQGDAISVELIAQARRKHNLQRPNRLDSFALGCCAREQNLHTQVDRGRGGLERTRREREDSARDGHRTQVDRCL